MGWRADVSDVKLWGNSILILDTVVREETKIYSFFYRIVCTDCDVYLKPPPIAERYSQLNNRVARIEYHKGKS